MTNFRMYESKPVISRKANAANAVFVRLSKIGLYEKPYVVTGNIKQTGLKRAPKSICKDRVVGTW